MMATQTRPAQSRPWPDHVTTPATTPSLVSVIIPTLNEERFIGRTIAQAVTADNVEVIVVDGGSRDDTVSVAASLNARIIDSSPGRGLQMNVGAAAARGDTLLFLHADTLLPPKFDRDVHQVLARPDVALGAFRFRLDERRAALALVEQLVAIRCRLFRLPYGDQGLFLRRNTFEALGGFRDLPIMEDFDFVRRAHSLGHIALADTSATTSARRWSTDGAARTTLVNQLCILAFLTGVPPQRIAAWRAVAKPAKERKDVPQI